MFGVPFGATGPLRQSVPTGVDHAWAAATRATRQQARLLERIDRSQATGLPKHPAGIGFHPHVRARREDAWPKRPLSSNSATMAAVSWPSAGAANAGGPGVRPKSIDCATPR